MGHEVPEIRGRDESSLTHVAEFGKEREREERRLRFASQPPRERSDATERKEKNMLAAIGGIGIVGIVVLVLIVLAALYFLRGRA